MSGPRAAGQHPDDPIPETPGMEQLFRALTAEGDAVELVGRTAALTMFRTARDLATSLGAAAPGGDVPGAGVVRGQQLRHRSPEGPPPQGPARPTGRSRRRRTRAILAGIAALLVVCAGLTAAAYLAVLPRPMQEFAHAVLARIGAPRAALAAPAPTASHSPSAGSSSSTNPNGPGNSPAFAATPSTSSPALGAGSVTVSLRVRRADVPFGNSDLFDGSVTTAGRTDAGIRVRLLERLAAGTGTWRLAAAGITRADGTVTLTMARVTGNATFRLSGTGPLAAASSPAVAVSVIPRLVVRVPAAGVLTASAWPAAAGDAVVLQEREDGTWRVVATHYLDSLHKATFMVASGATYRVVLPATTAHNAARSAPVTLTAA